MAEVENINQKVYLIEKINAEILQITVDSRGIYMTKPEDKEEIAKFADAIRKNLVTLQEYYGNWKKTLTDLERSNLSEFDKSMQLFVDNREKIAKLGTEVGPESANAFGNNEVNRESQKQLMKILRDTVEEANKQKYYILESTSKYIEKWIIL